MRMLKVNMKNKESYQDLFGISIDKKVTCVKPDRCIYVMPAESCSWMPPTAFMRRLYLCNFSEKFQKLLESAKLNNVELTEE